MPLWIKTIVVTAILTVAAWAAKDRLMLEQRISTLTEFVTEVDKRLDRIEQKLDRALGDR